MPVDEYETRELWCFDCISAYSEGYHSPALSTNLKYLESFRKVQRDYLNKVEADNRFKGVKPKTPSLRCRGCGEIFSQGWEDSNFCFDCVSKINAGICTSCGNKFTERGFNENGQCEKCWPFNTRVGKMCPKCGENFVPDNFKFCTSCSE